MNGQKKRQNNFMFVGLALFLGISFCVTYITYKTGHFPQGNDIYGHWFKTNVLYHSIKEGVLYPTYTPFWYNNIDLFRYWPPLSYYVLAFIMLFCGGSLEIAYPIYLGLMCFVGASGWLLFGKRENRGWLSVAIGCLYFFVPDNMRVMFSEGNMPRMIITAILPYLFFFVFDYVKYKNKKSLVVVPVLVGLALFSHVMISAMIGIATFLVLLVYAITNKTWKRPLAILVNMMLSYIAMGIVLVPALTGGIVSQNSGASVATSADWSQNLFITLNPIAHSRDFGLFYFGISIFFVILIGLFIQNKEVKPFFLSSLLILLSTSTVMVRFISILPLSQVFWMQRFVPIALVFFFVGIIYWKKCKTKVLLVFLLAVMLDSVSMVQFLDPYYDTPSNDCTLKKSQAFEEEYFLNEAKEIATNRVSFLDLSNTNSYPSYFFSRDMENSIPYMFGWAYQGAHTEKEIVRVNEALEYGYYNYALDRSLEMGCDTIIVKRDEIGKAIGSSSKEEERFLVCVKKLGYDLVNQNKLAYLLKYNLPENVFTFGTITNYENIAIGESAHYITYLYPGFEMGESSVLDDYEYEELLGYKKIFLSNFTYKNKEYVEQMLIQLSDNNVEIYIDMNNIPQDLFTGKKEFLGVYSQFVTFTESFPIISMKNGSEFKLPMDTSKYDRWYCSYLSEVYFNKRGSLFEEEKPLFYYGTSENEKIHFIGFNLVYYCVENRNEDLVKFFDEIFELSNGETPQREIVKTDVNYSFTGLDVTTNKDNVNTGLAYLDGFTTDSQTGEKHHLMIVNSGTTNIRSTYPYFKEGILVSVFGIVLLIVFYGLLAGVEKKGEKKYEENV